MRLYNVEFFNKNLEYVGSQQIPAFSYEDDYLSPTANTIELLKDTRVEVGNFVIIRSMTTEEKLYGIVTAITTEKTQKIKFKSLVSLLDVDAEIGTYTSVEGWLENAITNTFIVNDDEEQIIPRLLCKKTSSTKGNLGEEKENLIINIYDVCVHALKLYGIAVNFSIDLKKRYITVTIGKVVALNRVIEADLPNVIDKNIVIKNGDNALNKETIINNSPNGAGERATFYRDANGNITTEPASRVTPVVFAFSIIQCKSEEWALRSRERAERDLTPPAYNNLIEITVQEDDDLINADSFKIGQTVQIINNGTVYNTIFTGLSKKNGINVLFFGAIRLELTKLLKRRLK